MLNFLPKEASRLQKAKPKSNKKSTKEKRASIEKIEIVPKKVWQLSYEEVYHIGVSILVVALILTYNPLEPLASLEGMARAIFAVAVAIFFHLAAQKIMAHRLGSIAFYRLWLPGLVFSLLLMVVGIKPIILVGAVSLTTYKFGRFGYKSRQPSITEIGWVGVSGTLVNILLALIFSSVVVFPYLAFVNALIALFSLVPIKPLDGGKVFLWNPVYWLLLILLLVLILTPSGLLNLIP